MNLIPILLIRRAQQQRKSHSSSSRSSSSRPGSYDRDDYSSTSYSTPTTLRDYAKRYGTVTLKDKLYSRVMTLMHNNPEFMRIYGNIHTHITSCINAYTDKALIPMVDMPDIDDRFYAARDNALNKVISVPVDLVTTHGPTYNTTYIRYNPNETDPEKRISAKKFQPIAIYGLYVTEEMLKPGSNPFREICDKYIAEHPNYSEDYIAARKRVEKLERNKFLLKISQGRREKLVEAQKALKIAEGIKGQVERHQAHAENFDELSNEERAYLLEYVMAEKAVKESNATHGRELRLLLEFAGHETGYYALKQMREFYAEAIELLSPADREIFDRTPREIIDTLARASKEEFAALDSSEHDKYHDTRLSVSRFIKEEVVASSVEILESIPLDELSSNNSAE